MDLSIIIVNYNVKYFLEQCVQSVLNSIGTVRYELLIVDNNSVDSSVEHIKEKFPQLEVFANKENLGFSKANNQAILKAKGKYVLLLNPDTVVQENTLQAVFDFMETNDDGGGLGVKMVDGKGQFLPESKRGLPTPAVAFYKIFGLSKLFPHSQTFGQYHLSYLDKDKNHEIDILSGAFMLVRKTVIDQIGLLDETFFMYGEDIDWSYRIQKAGYKNYYFSGTSIIHYKGESTKKSSVNYVFVFYRAMAIFAKKHFAKNQAALFNFLINIAIYLRAGIDVLMTLIKNAFIYAFDFTAIVGLLFAIVRWYEITFKSAFGLKYDRSLLSIALPVYGLIWLGTNYMSGAYDKPVRPNKLLRGVLLGLILILAAYSLLPEIYRFSRAIILLGAIAVAFYYLFSRYVFHLLKLKGFQMGKVQDKRIGIAGTLDEFERVKELINRSGFIPHFIGRIKTECKDQGENTLGDLDQVAEIIRVHQIDEVIFCAKNIA